MKKEHIYSHEQKSVWWGDGEWSVEPDSVEFEYEGYKCKVLRQSHLDGKDHQYMFGGYLCGYIFIPSNHPFHEKPYEDIPVECHGGLTFGETLSGMYCIGFDCAHSFDYVPSIEHMKKTCTWMSPIKDLDEKLFNKFPNHKHLLQKTYRNIEFCIDQCEEIVDQLKEIK